MTTQAIEGGKAKRKAAKQAKTDAVARAKALAPDLAVRIGSTPKTKFRGDPGVFGRLVEDHGKHRALLAMIEETAGKSPERQRPFEELVKELKAHAAAEERSEEHTSELQSLMRISYAVFCLKRQNTSSIYITIYTIPRSH